MHLSSYTKMASFLKVYRSSFPRRDGRCALIEIGSKSYKGQRSYRDLIQEDQISYTGLDLEPGENVDLVAQNGYVWPELEDGSFDVCISGQTFEHNPFFWVTMAEISRILAPGGYACIIAPGAQSVHRFPIDCWRFFPDCWAPLCALTGLELVETYFETDRMAISVIDGEIRDSLLIARKPIQTSEEIERRLAQLTMPWRESRMEFTPKAQVEGPCIEDYRRTAARTPKLRARLARLIYKGGFHIFQPNS